MTLHMTPQDGLNERVILRRFRPWIDPQKKLSLIVTSIACRWDAELWADGKLECLVEIKSKLNAHSSAGWFSDEGVLCDLAQIDAMYRYHPYGYFVAGFSDDIYAIEIGSIMEFPEIRFPAPSNKVRDNHGSAPLRSDTYCCIRKQHMISCTES